jgi:hypothetical protein
MVCWKSDPPYFKRLQRSEGVARILLRQKHFEGQGDAWEFGARVVCQPPLPPPLSSTEPVLPNEERGMKTGTALTPGCAPLSLTRGYNHVTPDGVSVCVPQRAADTRRCYV